MRPHPPSDDQGADASPVTERLPTAGRTGAEQDDRARAIAVLDEPLDDKSQDLHEQIRRPGMSRSTRILLFVLAAVVIFGLGALLGRGTAPDTGPGSAPDVVGVVESVGSAGTGGTGQLTVRTSDGELSVLGTTVGTRVGVPAPDGLAGLRPGTPVQVSAQRNQLGSLDATHVEIADGP